MATKKSRIIPKPSLNLFTGFPEKEVFCQAWNLFIFSAVFAILFNTFYSDGIELKVKPPKSVYLMDRPKTDSQPMATYPGWKAPSPNGAHVKPTHPTASDNIPYLSLIGVKTRFDRKNCVFLDARNPEEYKDGHIPGAINFSALELDKFAPIVLPQLTNKDEEIVAYCNGGDCTLSLELARTLVEQGYKRVEVFEGGWPEWKKAAYPSQSGAVP